MILLVGPPGAGKSTFCHQTVLSNIEVRPVIYVTTESTPSKVADSLKQKGLSGALPHPLGFVDAFNETVGLSTADRRDTLNASSEDLTSLGIACISWIFLLLAIVLIILMNTLVIPEERWCLEKYGNAYREYMNRTPKWIGIPKSEKKD